MKIRDVSPIKFVKTVVGGELSSGIHSLCTDEFGSRGFGLLPEVLANLTAVASSLSVAAGASR